MLERTLQMTLAAFIQRTNQDGPFELIDGEVLPVSPTVSSHTYIMKRLFLALLPFEERGLGEVFSEATFVLSDDAEWVSGSRIPDVMFVLAATLQRFQTQIPDAERKPFILVPEIVAEIISPTDSYSAITRKVAKYLSDGVRLVWLIDPQRRVVTVKGELDVELTQDDSLTGGTVLPDFKLPVVRLLGQVEAQ